MKVSNKLQAIAAMALLLPLLAACGGSTPTNTPLPAAGTPTAAVAAGTPTAAMAMTATPGMVMTSTQMMAMTATPGTMMTGTEMMGTPGAVMTGTEMMGTPGTTMTGTEMMGTPGTIMTGTQMMGTPGTTMTGTQMMGTPGTTMTGTEMMGTPGAVMTGTTPVSTPAGPTPTVTPANVGTPSASATKITFWHTQTRTNAAALNGMIADFNKTHSDVFVQPEYKGGYTDLLKAAQAAAAGGDLPDLTVGYENWLPGLIKSDVVVPLDSYINDPATGLTADDKADIFPQFISTNQYPAYGNKMYSFPFTKSTLTMWYNNDLLKKINKTAPPATWAEFVDDSKAIRALGSDYYGFEFQNEPSMLVGMIYAFGGQMMNADNTQFVFSSPQGVAAMQLLGDGVKGGYFLMTNPGKFENEQDFAKKKVGFILESSTAYSFIPSYYPMENKTPVPGSDFDWSATVLPHGDGVSPVTTLYGGNIIMYKTTEARQKAAWEFIKWFTAKEQTAKWASVSGYMPLRKSAADIESLKTLYSTNPRAKAVFSNVLPLATASEPKVGSYQQVRDILQEKITNVAKGTQSAADAMKDAQDKANATMQ